jgi:DUF4097 and DUF4098 domain-containing protein YvlB
MKINIWLATAAMLACLLGSAIADIEDTVEKSYKVGDNGNLTVETDLGSIEVTAAGSGELKVTLYRKMDASTRKEADRILEDLETEFKQTGNDVSIIVRYHRDKSIFNWERSHLRLRFVIAVPKKYNVDLNTAGGSISVSDLTGKVLSRTSGGSLTFGHIQGPVDGKTSGGSITLDGCAGNADVRTSGGSIRIGEVDGQVQAMTSGGSINIEKARGSVVAETSGGGIHVDEVMGDINASTSGGSVSATITKQPAGPCRLKTSGGTITVELAPDIKVDVDAATSGGRVTTEFPVTVQGELSKTHLHATVNGGGPELLLRTSGGSIHINKVSTH